MTLKGILGGVLIMAFVLPFAIALFCLLWRWAISGLHECYWMLKRWKKP